MISSDLYQRALLDPISMKNADELLIVSGYSNALMARRHIDYVKEELKSDIRVRLIIGMSGEEGVNLNTHQGLLKLRKDKGDQFTCSYVTPPNGVHSKLYLWNSNGQPVDAWVGSANYTQRGFGLLSTGSKRFEILTGDSPDEAYDYFQEIEALSTYVDHGEIESMIQFTKSKRAVHEDSVSEIAEEDSSFSSQIRGLKMVMLPLYSHRTNEVHEKSGLNWGQREGRNPNQAYLPIPKRGIGDSGFFPPRGTYFTVKTDDGKELVFTRAQDDGKALHTPQNNAQLGEYFRNRLGVPNGIKVTRQMLANYGADSVLMYKVDDEQYFLDFSPRTP